MPARSQHGKPQTDRRNNSADRRAYRSVELLRQTYNRKEYANAEQRPRHSVPDSVPDISAAPALHCAAHIARRKLNYTHKHAYNKHCGHVDSHKRPHTVLAAQRRHNRKR